MTSTPNCPHCSSPVEDLHVDYWDSADLDGVPCFECSFPDTEHYRRTGESRTVGESYDAARRVVREHFAPYAA